MVRYADPTRCPDCGAPIPAQPVSCPRCGLPLTGLDAVALFQTLQAADRLLVALRSQPAAAPVVPKVTAADATTATPAAPGLRLSGASVPKILLTLGALCLLVAAIIFLAVAWSWLGVGGRTAVLVGLTVVAGGTATWLGRRGLRIAAEALSVVAFGLLTLDVIGADNAGWLGDLTASGLVAVTGLVVGGVALGLAWLTNRGDRSLVAPQVFAGLGLGVVPAGVSGTTGHDAAVFALACVALLGLARLAGLLRIGLLPWIFGALAALWWFPLAATALVRMIEHPTARELWLDLHAWPALCAAGLLLLGAWIARARPLVPQLLVGVAATILSLVVAFPSFDEGTTALTLTLLAFVVGWSVALLAAPARWLPAPTVPLLAAAAAPALVGLQQAVTAVGNVTGDTVWGSSASVRIDPLSPEGHPALLLAITAVGCLALVALARHVTSPVGFARAQAPFLLAAVALAAVGTLTSYAVPLAVVPAGLLLVSAGLLGWGLPRTDARGAAALVVALVLAGAGLLTALPSVVLTLVTILITLAGAILVALRGADAVRRTAAEVVVPPAAALATAAVADLAGLSDIWRGLPVLLVVGALALVRPRPQIEVPAAISGLVASAAALVALTEPLGDPDLLPVEVYLTVAGALVTASAVIHPQRRLLGWPGGLLLVMASWVRLADVGVTAPEAYTMPSAVALVLVGLHRLRRDQTAGTLPTLAPGLLLATVPSLLCVLGEDPVSWRALLLGLGCLALVLAGATLRWQAPLVIGAAVGGVLVLWEAGPYAAELPLWVVIALAGTLLTVVGVTWESRLNNLRTAQSYLARLR